MSESGQILFHHEVLGDLVIDNGLDDAAWAYRLNTQSFPTYGGEVVQILSVFIDDLSLSGTCATYAQMELIHQYFTGYLQIATQGKHSTPGIGESTLGQAYNLQPVWFSYPARKWFFQIYPKDVPGFHYGLTVTAPIWQINCFVVDDSPDINWIREGLKALHVSNLAVPEGSDQQVITGIKNVPPDQAGLFTISGELSPLYGDPNADPFQTFDSTTTVSTQQIKYYADYYSSLIPKWAQGNLDDLLHTIGSQPTATPGLNTSTLQGPTPKIKVPKTQGSG